MRIETAVKTLDKQAKWLGLSAPDLLLDIKKHGRMLYPELVVEAFNVYSINQQVKKELLND